MTLCDCYRSDSAWVCKYCGRKFALTESMPRAACRGAGLGDMVAAGLSAVGITKERVSKLAGGDCGCAKRQEALNKLGHKLGIGSPTPSGPSVT